MFHLLVSYLQTPAQPLIRGNLYSRDSCLGPEGIPWKEVPLYNFNPLFLLFILINFPSILGTQLCVIVILNLKQWKIKFEVRASLSHNISTLLLATVRALSKSQNWPAGPWPHRSFWKWNRLFPWVFDEKRFPSCILFGIWLIWLDSFD